MVFFYFQVGIGKIVSIHDYKMNTMCVQLKLTKKMPLIYIFKGFSSCRLFEFQLFIPKLIGSRFRVLGSKVLLNTTYKRAVANILLSIAEV